MTDSIATLAIIPEPTPTGGGAEVYPALIAGLNPAADADLIAALQARDQMGRAKYQTPLTTKNGRRALVDLLQEALDAMAYAEQVSMEGNAQSDTIRHARYHAYMLARYTLAALRDAEEIADD